MRNIFGNGTFLPSITLTATPMGNVSCYAVTETLAPGLTPSGLAANSVWNPANNTIVWGPYLDHQPRALTYELNGPSGTYLLVGQVSFDGHPSTATGAATVSLNTAYAEEPTNFTTCVTVPISYTVDIDPAPGIIVVDTASGTVDWGDGTQAVITQPMMTFQKYYSIASNYTVTVSVNWTGHTMTASTSGSGTTTDDVLVLSSCDGPVITSQPTNQVVLAGATAQFTVGASSYFPMSYQWFFNQTNPIYSSETFATLTLPNVTVDAAGSYYVLISNAYGITNSALATLTLARLSQLGQVVTRKWLQIRAAFQKVCTKVILRPVVLSA